MNARRDPDRLIQAFLMEGQTELADQVYDAVRSSIEQRRQRVVFGPWRTPFVSKLVPIGLGAAAVVVALVMGTRLLGAAPSGPGASATPTATQPATPGPTATPSAVPSPLAVIDEGPYVLFESRHSGTPITVTIAAPGWSGDQENGFILRANAQPPDGAGLIAYFGPLWVYGDPCSWSTTTSTTSVNNVDAFIAAMTAQPARNASPATDITLDGHSGKSITLHVPDDADFLTCDEGIYGSWKDEFANPAPNRYHQGPGQVDELWVVEVNGELVVIDAAYFEGTPTDHVAEMRAMAESAVIRLP